MRASSLLYLGASALTVITILIGDLPGYADSTYTADELIASFAMAKAKVKAAKLGKHVMWCFELDPGCPRYVDFLVEFVFDSDKLEQTAKANLEQLALTLNDPKIKGSIFEIGGFIDATGNEQYNLGLSARRAEAVAAYLTSLGVDPATLRVKGYGKDKPRVPSRFSSDRRVEIHLLE